MPNIIQQLRNELRKQRESANRVNPDAPDVWAEVDERFMGKTKPKRENLFAPEPVTTSGESGLQAHLKAIMSGADPEAIEDLAVATGNPEAVEEARANLTEEVAAEFVSQTPDYYSCPENHNALLIWLATHKLHQPYLIAHPPDVSDSEASEVGKRLFERKMFTLTTLSEAWAGIKADGLHTLMPGAVRSPLTDEELLRVARLAQQGYLQDAITEYLRCSLCPPGKPWVADQVLERYGTNFINQPQYRQLMDDAVMFIFSSITNDFIADSEPEFMELVRRAARNKPLNVGLVQALWTDFKRQRGLLRGAKPAPPRATEVAEAMVRASDEEIEQAYRATARQRANAVRRAYANPAEQISESMAQFETNLG